MDADSQVTPSSAEATGPHSGSAAPSMSAVIALAVLFSLLGSVFLLALLMFALRRRREIKRALRNPPPKVVFEYHAETVTHPPEISRVQGPGEEGGSGICGSPTRSELTESFGYSPNYSANSSIPRKPLLQAETPRVYYDGRGHENVRRVEAIPIPTRQHPNRWARIHTEQVQLESTPRHERTSSELFYAAPANVQRLAESSPTPSSMCIHGSTHSHEENRPLKIGNVAMNLPLVYFPQDHEGHVSARASMHSGNTHFHGAQAVQRTRTGSLPLVQPHLRKARSVENIGVSRKPFHRPSRKEVPKYVLDESGVPIEPATYPAEQPSASSAPFDSPNRHSKTRPVSMHMEPLVPPE